MRVGVEDVRADPTGPQEADASGGAEEHDQSWLIGRFLERGLQLADAVQVGERSCELAELFVELPPQPDAATATAATSVIIAARVIRAPAGRWLFGGASAAGR